MKVEEQIALAEEILGEWKDKIGNDFEGYKNHVYRMINFCFALNDFDNEEREKIIVAGCFHDIGIWTGKTFDYLPPSISAASEYLTKNGLEKWFLDIELMIEKHHKITAYSDGQSEKNFLVETFRKGDLVDFSLGIIKCGLPSAFVKNVKETFPNAGFHKGLVKLAGGWICCHPLNPVPVIRF